MKQLQTAVRFPWPGRILLASVCIACLFSVGCSVQSAKNKNSGNSNQAGGLSGTIRIDGSSTVLPISKAVAEEFMKLHKVDVVVGSTGTGGGFTKFAAGETDINDASRPIKDIEQQACDKNHIEPVALKIAIDGLSVVVNSQNDWCHSLTVNQLKKLWEPNSAVKKWSDLNPEWPAEVMKLYGPDTSSGTFDYFTEVVCGKSGASRTDYQPSADDNSLVAGVSGDKYSLGYFGYAYFVENRDKLKVIGIASNSKPDAPVLPTDETIESGTYTPLSRPLFLYVNKKAIQRPEVAGFLNYYLNEGQSLVHEVGYIRLNDDVLKESKNTLQAAGG